ncbi:hypothetical protein FRC00_005441, partial [Tulasnella sp. 408]
MGQIKTIPAPLLVDFFDANPLLESVHVGQTLYITKGPTASGTHLLPSLKHINARPAALVAWFLGDLPDGSARPLVSISVSVSLDEDSENNPLFSGMSRAVGEGLKALSISFDIPEPRINWTNLISDISSRCPNIRRLDIKGFRRCFGIPLIEERSHPNLNSFDYWVAPLQSLSSLELLNVPNGFFEYLVIQTKEMDGKLSFNQDAILNLTRTCPSLRLINGSPDRGSVQKSCGLIYLRPANGAAKLIDLEKYKGERFTTAVELSDEGQSNDFTCQLYSVPVHASVPAKEDLWK